MAMLKTNIIIRINKGLKQKAEKLALSKQKTLSEYIRDLLQKEIQNNENEQKKQIEPEK